MAHAQIPEAPGARSWGGRHMCLPGAARRRGSLAIAATIAIAVSIALAGPAAAQAGPNQCDGFLRFLSYHSTIAPGGEEVQYFAQVHSTYADIGMQPRLSYISAITSGGVTYQPLRPVDSFEIRGGQQRTIYLLTLRVAGVAAPPADLVGRSVRFTCPGTFHRRPVDRFERPDRP